MMHFWDNETELAQVGMTRTGGNPWGKAHTLHPVIDGAAVFSEADGYDGAVVRGLWLCYFLSLFFIS